MIGIEIDPQRVENAKAFENETTHFRVGGFNYPLLTGESPTLVRAFNVLRQYEVTNVQPAWEQVAKPLAEGGLLLEGTSSPFGKIWTANLLRKRTKYKHCAQMYYAAQRKLATGRYASRSGSNNRAL